MDLSESNVGIVWNERLFFDPLFVDVDFSFARCGLDFVAVFFERNHGVERLDAEGGARNIAIGRRSNRRYLFIEVVVLVFYDEVVDR